MGNKKKYIIAFIILVLFGVIMFLLLGVNNIRENQMSTTLIVGDNTIWHYSEKKWVHLTSAKSFHNLEWKQYHIYLDNKKYGDYYLWHDDKWYAFDSRKNAVPLKGELLAIKSNYDIPVEKGLEENVDDSEYINQVLSDYNLSLSSHFTSKYKVLFDFDSDGVEEEFYVISNVFALDFQPDTLFSIVFMVKDDTIYPIYQDISSNQSMNGCKPFFKSFLDLNEDQKYEFILSCGYYANEKQIDMLYHFDQEEFKIIISSS